MKLVKKKSLNYLLTFILVLLSIFIIQPTLNSKNLASKEQSTTVKQSPKTNNNIKTATQKSIPYLLGGGNFPNGIVNENFNWQLKTLNTAGIHGARFNLYPRHYYNDSDKKVVLSIDKALLKAYKHQINPMILFEYYSHFSEPIGGYDKWYDIGKAYAERYKPNGIWAQKNDISNFGITLFSAFNEPEGTKLSKADYHNALKGLADGVKSVDPSLEVIPGGYKYPNKKRDFKMDGFLPAIAGLLNTGKLDGIDIHNYFDVTYSPLFGTFYNSSQTYFDKVKSASGIKADINFYTTEFNYKSNTNPNISEDQLAVGLLPAVWSQLGVIKNDGSPATKIAYVWNIFNNSSKDRIFGLNLNQPLSHWKANSRGKVIQLVGKLTKNMKFTHLDPKGKGEYILEGVDPETGVKKKLWIFQNINGWTNQLGNSYTLKNIPPGTTAIKVYRWKGLKVTIKKPYYKGQDTYTVNGLNKGETYMFLCEYSA